MTDSTVLLSFTFAIIGCVLVVMKICFASKCDEVNVCFGLLQVHRNVLIENREIQQPNSPRRGIRQMNIDSGNSVEVVEQLALDQT
jgi:hypothetical protein